MRTSFAVVCFWLFILFIVGCDPDLSGHQRPRLRPGDREFLSVDFQSDKVLRYKFISDRQIEVDLGPGHGKSKDVVHKVSETMELVIS